MNNNLKLGGIYSKKNSLKWFIIVDKKKRLCVYEVISFVQNNVVINNSLIKTTLDEQIKEINYNLNYFKFGKVEYFDDFFDGYLGQIEEKQLNTLRKVMDENFE